jgi:hypothetical protein
MTSSPDLIRELRAARPTAPATLRARVRGLADGQPRTTPFAPSLFAAGRLRTRRAVLVVVPAAAALALVSAGTLGIVRSGGSTEALERQTTSGMTSQSAPSTELTAPQGATDSAGATPTPNPSATGKASDRAERVSATLTVEVQDSDAVADAAQDVLALTRSLGGYVVSSNVVTGDEASAAIVVRVPSDRVQQAIVELSTLGRIVSQQVTIEDLQEELDAMLRRANSLREQIARITARLESETLDDESRAVLEARRRALRAELRQLRGGIAADRAEARMATIQLAVVTPRQTGAVAPPSRLDRTLDEALNVLLWEGVVALALAIVLAPFALVALVVWLGHRLYRRREEERLLAAH